MEDVRRKHVTGIRLEILPELKLMQANTVQWKSQIALLGNNTNLHSIS